MKTQLNSNSSWTVQAATALVAGLALLLNALLGVKISATLLAYPTVFLASVGLALLIGGASILAAYYLPLKEDTRFNLDALGSILLAGGWASATIAALGGFPSTAFFLVLSCGFCLNSALHFRHLVRLQARGLRRVRNAAIRDSARD